MPSPSKGTPPRKRQVAILGNSNSIVRYSYVQYLRQFDDISIRDASIGDNSNVFLADVLVCHAVADADVIVVETSVIDAHWTRVQRMGEGEARDGLDLFLTALRRVSAAPVILLVLPVRQYLLAPEPLWAEQMAAELSQRFGVQVLNLYGVLRPALAHWAREPRKLDDVSKGVLDAAGLPVGLWLDFLWLCGLRFLNSPLSPLHRMLFADELHPANVVHALAADLLHGWMSRLGPAQAAPVAQAAPLISAVLPDSAPLPPLERRSSLLARQMLPLRPGQTLTYVAPQGWRALGLMLNRAATYGVLRITGADGRAVAADVRFGGLKVPFLANVLPIWADLGPGPYHVTLAGAPKPGEALLRYWDPGPVRPVGAELAEMVLVQDNWRDAVPPPHPQPAPEPVETLPWAQPIIAAFLRAAETGAAAAETAAVTIAPTLLDAVIVRMGNSDPPAMHRIRLRLAAGQIDQALDEVDAHLADAPEDERAEQLRGRLLGLKTLLKR